MKITEGQLRGIIRELMSREDAKLDYGDVLFGDERAGKTPANVEAEPDTMWEKDLVRSLKSWYRGNLRSSITRMQVRYLADLVKTGLYDDVLKLPPGVKKLYRMIALDHQSVFDKYAGDPISPDKTRGLTAEEKEEIEKGNVEIRMIKAGSKHDLFSNPVAASWSSDPGAVVKIHRDFFVGPGTGRGLAYLIADVKRNPGAFILNSDEMAPIAGDYEYQREALQIAPSVFLTGGVIAWQTNKRSKDLLDDIVDKAFYSFATPEIFK